MFINQSSLRVDGHARATTGASRPAHNDIGVAHPPAKEPADQSTVDAKDGPADRWFRPLNSDDLVTIATAGLPCRVLR